VLSVLLAATIGMVWDPIYSSPTPEQLESWIGDGAGGYLIWYTINAGPQQEEIIRCQERWDSGENCEEIEIDGISAGDEVCFSVAPRDRDGDLGNMSLQVCATKALLPDIQGLARVDLEQDVEELTRLLLPDWEPGEGIPPGSLTELARIFARDKAKDIRLLYNLGGTSDN
jgi:hypothetical protein